MRVPWLWTGRSRKHSNGITDRDYFDILHFNLSLVSTYFPVTDFESKIQRHMGDLSINVKIALLSDTEAPRSSWLLLTCKVAPTFQFSFLSLNGVTPMHKYCTGITSQPIGMCGYKYCISRPDSSQHKIYQYSRSDTYNTTRTHTHTHTHTSQQHYTKTHHAQEKPNSKSLEFNFQLSTDTRKSKNHYRQPSQVITTRTILTRNHVRRILPVPLQKLLQPRLSPLGIRQIRSMCDLPGMWRKQGRILCLILKIHKHSDHDTLVNRVNIL